MDPNEIRNHLYALSLLFIFKDFMYLFLERGVEEEREGEKHQCAVASHSPLTGVQACNLDMCPRLGIEPAKLWFAGWHSIQNYTCQGCLKSFNL